MLHVWCIFYKTFVFLGDLGDRKVKGVVKSQGWSLFFAAITDTCLLLSGSTLWISRTFTLPLSVTCQSLHSGAHWTYMDKPPERRGRLLMFNRLFALWSRIHHSSVSS